MPDTPYSQRLLKRTEFETLGLNQQMAQQDLSIQGKVGTNEYRKVASASLSRFEAHVGLLTKN